MLTGATRRRIDSAHLTRIRVCHDTGAPCFCRVATFHDGETVHARSRFSSSTSIWRKVVLRARLSPEGSQLPLGQRVGAIADLRTRFAGQASRPTVRHWRMFVPGSFSRSSRVAAKISPPISGPLKSPTGAGFYAAGLGVRSRTDPANYSPKADFSLELGTAGKNPQAFWFFFSRAYFH
jgi:hypothetical protein